MTPVAVLCVLAFVGIGFVLVRSGDPSRPDKGEKAKPRTRRDELLEARRQIRRQIEILTQPERGRDYTSYSHEGLKRLQALLQQIEDELEGARTGPLLVGRGVRQRRTD